MDLIRIKNVEKRYKNGVTAIYDLNLAIEKGSFVFVIGGSGSGKSTLIKMLYREEKPTKGQVIVGGLDVAKLKDKKVQVGLTIVTVVAGTLSGLVVKKIKKQTKR